MAKKKKAKKIRKEEAKRIKQNIEYQEAIGDKWWNLQHLGITCRLSKEEKRQSEALRGIILYAIELYGEEQGAWGAHEALQIAQELNDRIYNQTGSTQGNRCPDFLNRFFEIWGPLDYFAALNLSSCDVKETLEMFMDWKQQF